MLALTVPPATMAAMLAAIFATFGVAQQALNAVLFLVLSAKRRLGTPPPGPAMQATVNAEAAYRAAYLVAGSVRVQNATNRGATLQQAIAGEQRNLELHEAAQVKRRQAAEAVDHVSEMVPMARAYGPAAPPGASGSVPLAGWKAVLDGRTSAECRAADGKNFRVDAPPIIGYPGTVHVHCRCRAVKPYTGAPVMDTLTPALPHR